MTPRPNNRVVKAGDTVTRQVVGASTKQQAQRAMATVREILGRDPAKDDVFIGGTGLVERKPKQE